MISWQKWAVASSQMFEFWPILNGWTVWSKMSLTGEKKALIVVKLFPDYVVCIYNQYFIDYMLNFYIFFLFPNDFLIAKSNCGFRGAYFFQLLKFVMNLYSKVKILFLTIFCGGFRLQWSWLVTMPKWINLKMMLILKIWFDMILHNLFFTTSKFWLV